jgi:enamine deaminase RidA (YjgF/YER057c/UK114 family)
MTRTHAWPDGHWGWPIAVSHKHGVRQDDLCFVGGQVDLSPDGAVLHPRDLASQTAAAMASVGRVLTDLGSDLADLVKLQVFYVTDGSVDEAALMSHVRSLLGAEAPVLTTVPVPYLAYPDMVVEIEAVAAVGEKQRIGTGPFPDALRWRDIIWTSAHEGSTPGDIVAQSREVMDGLGATLARFGADLADAVKFNIYYVGVGTAEDWEIGARVRASFFPEPGPAATGIPLPRLHDDAHVIKMDVWAMLGEDGSRLERRHSWPDGHWDWPIHLPYKHGCECNGMVFVGGQVSLTPHGQPIDFDDLAAQTRTSMANIRRVLEPFDAGLDDVVRVLTFYEGDGSGDDLHENLAIRSASFSEPGPSTTGISLPCLAYDGMVIEIEVIAMPAGGRPGR